MNLGTTLGAALHGIESGKSFQTSDTLARDNELGVLKVSAVTWSSFRPAEAKAVIDYSPAEHHRVRAGDFLISRANTRELVGAVVLVERDYPLRLLSDKTLRLIVDLEQADPRYLLYALRTEAARNHIEHYATGTSDSMRNISQEVIATVPIVLPRLDEQRRIATRLKAQLAAVEDARQAAQAQAREVEALQASVYRNAFEGIVPVTVPPDFESRPAGWRWMKLADLARLESGHTPSRSRPDWWGGDISWVSLTEIRALDGRWIEQTQLRTNPAGIANSAARVLPRGTVCFSRTASVGFVVIMGKPMATSQDFANWVCGDDLDPDFLMHALIRSRKELRAIATGATHKTIYMPALESFHACLPKREVQERIVHRLRNQLEAIETMRQSIRARLADLERLPARLLAEAFHPSSEEAMA